MAIDFKSMGDMTWRLLWQMTISPKLKTENMAHFDEKKNIKNMNSYWSSSGFVVLLTAQLPVSDYWVTVRLGLCGRSSKTEILIHRRMSKPVGYTEPSINRLFSTWTSSETFIVFQLERVDVYIFSPEDYWIKKSCWSFR